VRAQHLALSALFAALTAVGALITVPLPFSPVPVTLQTLFTCLAALLLGAKLGALSQLTYLLLGCAGLPVFAGLRGGAGVLLGPTGGYLVGFVAGALLGGTLAERGRPSLGLFLASALLTTATVYALGVAWLSVSTGLGLREALLVGVAPFLPGDALKALASAWVALRVCGAVQRLPGCGKRR